MLCDSDIIKFPFIKDAVIHASKFSLTDLGGDEIAGLIDEYLHNVLVLKKTVVKKCENVETEVKRFIGTCLVMNQVNKEQLLFSFTDVESRHYVSLLEDIYYKDDNKKENFYIYFSMIFKQVFNKEEVEIKKSGNKYVLKIPRYLMMLKSFSQPDIKLINQFEVRKGYVFFNTKTLFEILRRGIKSYLTEKIKNMTMPSKTKFYQIEQIPKGITDLIFKYRNFTFGSTIVGGGGGDSNKKQQTGSLPPCIKHVISKLVTSNATHLERLTLASFLLKKNNGEIDDNMIDIFRNADNFNEKTTLYQLNQIKHGDYMIPSCDKINLGGFCFRDKKICGNIKNPIQLLTN